MVVTVLLMAVLVGSVMAQGDVADATLTNALGNDFVFWSLLAAGVLVLLVLGTLIGAGMASWVRSMEDKIPSHAMIYYEAGKAALLPVAYRQSSNLFDRGVDVLEARAERTLTQFDDDLVEMLDAQGRRVLVKAFKVMDYDPDKQADVDAVAQAQEGKGRTGETRF
jgi:hypothetical protein